MPTPNTTHSSDPQRWLGRWFTAARRQGFLSLLTPEHWHTLSAILSFTCRDGERRFTLDQLAVALGVPREAARERLDQLSAVQWQEQLLVVPEQDAAGELAGARLAPLELLAQVQTSTDEGSQHNDLQPIHAGERSDLPSSLAGLGLTDEQVSRLLRDFPEERIRRQLEWLPSRQARNPAALLIRAVEGDWSAPKGAE